MSTETVQETALAGLAALYGSPLRHGSPESFELLELPRVGLANLRVDPGSPAIAAALQQAFGLALPVAANTVAQGRGITALWLAPDEWLLRTDDAATDLVAQVEQALAGQWFAVTPQTSGFTVMQLRGRGTRDVLNGGCPLDLHPRALPFGMCAQSHFFKASVVLRPLDGENRDWELIVRRSFADYTARMLLDVL